MEYLLSMIGNCVPPCLSIPFNIETSFELIDDFNFLLITINPNQGYNIKWNDVKIVSQKNTVFIKYYEFEKNIPLPEDFNYNNTTAIFNNNCIVVRIPSFTFSKNVSIINIINHPAGCV